MNLNTTKQILSVLVSTLGLGLLTLPAQASTLTSWKFDPQHDRLSFTTDQAVRPKAKLISNPTRLVVDLPGIRLKRPKITSMLNGHFNSLRIGQLDPKTTRLVVELDPKYGFDPSQIKVQGASRRSWSVVLPEPTQGDRLADKTQIALTVPNIPPDFIRSGTFGGALRVGQEMTWLQQRLRAVQANYPGVKPSFFIVDLQNGDYAGLKGDQPFPAASIIKLSILIAFFQDLDAGKVSLSEKLVMRPELIASGSGYMQDNAPWSSYSALYTIGKMIETSDNTATNMIIKRLGGAAVLNARFKSWGLKDTVIRNWLPDLTGTNTVSAQDLALLLTKLDKGTLLSPSSQARAIAILKTSNVRTLLNPGLGPGAQIAHKTGDIGFAISDAGIIYMPDGRKYIAAVILIRPYDDVRGRKYCQTLSRITYNYFLNRSNSQALTSQALNSQALNPNP